jgi:uncharacterized protein (TIGR00369 family)
VTEQAFEPGDHFHDLQRWEDMRPEGGHIWRTLGFRRTVWEPGRQVVEWDATEDYGFPTNAGSIIHGGMVATILDTAMGGACWTLLNKEDAFLTADLRVEYFRSARPGLLRAEGRVVRKARRVIFCAADLYQDGHHLAGARCTQIVLPADSKAGRVRKKAPED